MSCLVVDKLSCVAMARSVSVQSFYFLSSLIMSAVLKFC